MKTKASKFWAVFTCIAILLSLGAPILSLAFSDDDCCDHHLEEGHIHDCSSNTCGHDTDPDDSKPTGSNEQGGGSTDNIDCDDDDCDCEAIIDCDGEDCDCDDVVDCDEEECTCAEVDAADCACEDECECIDCECADCEDCVDELFADIAGMSADVVFSVLSPPAGGVPVPFANWGSSDGGVLESHGTFLRFHRTTGWHGLDRRDIGNSSWGWGATAGDTIIIRGSVSDTWAAGRIWVGLNDADWVNDGLPNSASPSPGGTFELKYTITDEPVNARMRVRSETGGAGTFDITGIWVVPASSGGDPEEEVFNTKTLGGLNSLVVGAAFTNQGVLQNNDHSSGNTIVAHPTDSNLRSIMIPQGSDIRVVLGGWDYTNYTYSVTLVGRRSESAAVQVHFSQGQNGEWGQFGHTGHGSTAVNTTVAINVSQVTTGNGGLGIAVRAGTGVTGGYFIIDSLVIIRTEINCLHEWSETGLCSNCNTQCSHSAWTNGKCDTCSSDRRCGIGALKTQEQCGPFEQPNATNHQCRTCWGGWITCTPAPGSGSCVCGRVVHTHNWVNGVCQNSGCNYPGGQCPHTWTYNNTTNHRCTRCQHTQPHTFPRGGGNCTASGCNAYQDEDGNVDVVLSPCGMCGTITDWHWQGNDDRHWSSSGCCDRNEPHTYVNGVCRCGAVDTRTPCGMCGTLTNWHWQGNVDRHWSSSGCCDRNEPHTFVNGVCRCGEVDTRTPCGMCGTVGNWHWQGNDDRHWSSSGCCDRNEPHTYVNGVCRCGAEDNGDANGTPCGICGVVGPWSWGGNADTHWAENCNCTGSEPHSFDPFGRCRCGATIVVAPQALFREEDFIDEDSLIDDIRRAIEAGEVPTIDLTDAGSVTVISADILLAIAELGVDVVIILPSGFTFTIIASSISADVGAFDLNIEVLVKHEDVQLDTIGGGKVDVSANSLVFKPNFHGEFGFELVFHVTAEQIAHAGIDVDTIGHYHVCAVGNVTEKDEPTVNDDGSVNFPMSHASFHVLSSDPPVTAELGQGVMVDEAPRPILAGGEPAADAPAPISLDDVVQQAQSLLWIMVAVSATGLLIAAGLTTVLLIRRRNARRA